MDVGGSWVVALAGQHQGTVEYEEAGFSARGGGFHGDEVSEADHHQTQEEALHW